MTAPATAPVQPNLARRVAGQGALLMSGFAASQIMSFARNAMLGHMLAKGDFGVAAILTLLLQLLDSLTDLGVDRLIVQAKDGYQPRFMATNHFALVLRGVLIGTILFVAAVPIAEFFGVPDTSSAIAIIALVPLIKGFQHLDARRAQRHLNNRPFLWIEVAPQAVALAWTWPAVTYFHDYHAVVWLSLAQAVTTLLISHSVAKRPYQLTCDAHILRRLIDFGWPIWLSAFPLIAVYHGDRIVIARVIGVDELAGYSAAFMVAMVPGLIAAKVGQSLMLPLFAAARNDVALLARRFAAMTEATAIVAAVYLATAMLLGGFILQIAFGSNYAGLGGVMGWLAAMWAARMLQAAPGMVLIAYGETRPFFVAGTIRAMALVPATYAALSGYGLEMIAAIGFLGELASLSYIAWRMETLVSGFSALFSKRASFLLTAAAAAGAVVMMAGQADVLVRGVGLLAVLLLIGGIAAAILPETRHRLQQAAGF